MKTLQHFLFEAQLCTIVFVFSVIGILLFLLLAFPLGGIKITRIRQMLCKHIRGVGGTQLITPYFLLQISV